MTAGFLAGHLLAGALFAAVAASAGLLVARPLLPRGTAERLGLALALGMALLAHALFLLGLAGGLRRPQIVLLALAVLAAAARPVARLAADVAAAAMSAPAALRAAAAAVAGCLLLLALYPPTAFDETLYHLPYVRAFAAAGNLPFLTDLRVPVFTQLAEVLAVPLFLFAGDTATHLVALSATLATVVLLYVWGHRVGERAAWLAPAILVGSPLAAYLAGTGYVEPVLALFVTAALYAGERWREEPAALGWLAAAAFFAGTAAAVKYLGLFFLGALLLEVAWVSARRRLLRPLVVAAAVALAAAGPTYARIVGYSGSPLFPFYPEIFGASPWQPPGWPPAGPTAWHERATVLWDMTFADPRPGRQPPASPAYVLGLPALLLAAGRDWRARRVALVAGGYLLLAPPDARYLSAVLPALGAAVATGLDLAGRSRVLAARARVAALAALLVLPGWLWAAYHLGRSGPLPTTPAARQDFLGRRLPLYPALAFLNRRHGERYTVYALHAEQMLYYCRGRLLGDHVGRARFALLEPVLGQPAELHRRLRAAGADHLLVPRGLGVTLAEDERFRRVYTDPAAEVFALAPAAPAATD